MTNDQETWNLIDELIIYWRKRSSYEDYFSRASLYDLFNYLKNLTPSAVQSNSSGFLAPDEDFVSDEYRIVTALYYRLSPVEWNLLPKIIATRRQHNEDQMRQVLEKNQKEEQARKDQEQQKRREQEAKAGEEQKCRTLQRDQRGEKTRKEWGKIKFLFYLVPIDNLISISRSGILSRNRVCGNVKMLVDIADINVIEMRKRKTICNRSLLDFVPLYFTPKNPMLFRRREIQDKIAILCLNKNLLLLEGMVFTDGNASSMGTRCFRNPMDLENLDWDCIRAKWWSDFEDGKRKRCAEVLIPEQIPFLQVQKIITRTEDARSWVYETIGEKKKIESIAFPTLGTTNGGLSEDEVIPMMTSHLKKCDLPIEIYRYKADAVDDLYLEFRKRVLSEKNEEEMAKTMNLRVDRLRRIRDAVQSGPEIKSLSQLARVRGIGLKSLEKCFHFVMGKLNNVETGIREPDSRYATNDSIGGDSQQTFIF